VDQFLAYSQGEAGAALGGAQPLQALVHQVAIQYADVGHDVSVIREDAIDIQVPDVSLQRVLSNLIDNALAHGSGPVELELRGVPGGAELVVFDHGPGISPHELEQALTPFVRMGDKEMSQGHCGLGLAIVAQIAAQLKGRVLHRPFDGQRAGLGLFVPAASARPLPS
jgi:two-component system osmolarity sensor histidine kinase EnvZ